MRKIKKEGIRNLIMQAEVRPSKSGSIPLCPYTSTCKGSWIWFEASGLHDMFDAVLPLGLFLDIALVFCVVETLQLWVSSRS